MTARDLVRSVPTRLPLAPGPSLVTWALVLAGAYVAGPSLLMTALAAAVMWISARGPAERALAVLLPAGFRIALAAGAFSFEPPVQILELAVKNVDPAALIAEQDLWWPRYLVSYPPIVAMDHWGMRFGDAFALYNVALLPITATALSKAVRIWRPLDQARVLVLGLGLGLLVGLLATQMNGRLIPAHLGMALILLAQGRIFAIARLGLRDILLLVTGIVLGHMSSGTGLIAYAQSIAAGGVLAIFGIERRRVLALLWLLTVVFGPLLYRDVVKNAAFYGGGVAAVVTMLDHGAGVFLRRDARLLAASLTLATALSILLWRARRRIAEAPRALWPAMIALPVTMIGGLYGYSTLTMGIPAAMVLAGAGAAAMLDRGQTSRGL